MFDRRYSPERLELEFICGLVEQGVSPRMAESYLEDMKRYRPKALLPRRVPWKRRFALAWAALCGRVA